MGRRLDATERHPATVALMTPPDRPPIEDVLRSAGLATLGQHPPAEALEASLRRIAMVADGADALRVAALREAAVRALSEAGVRAPARMVDAALSAGGDDRVADAPSPGQGSRLALSDPEPWPDPVDGAVLLGELVRTFTRYVALPEGAATALALWVLHAHAHNAAAVSPILAITSPEKRCGKTTLLHVLGALVPRPLPASNITPAALFRAVERFGPTLLVDEADTFIREREELRGVLNSGHARASAVVVRAVASGDDYEAVAFSTWAPKAVALIDSGTTLPDTLRDRSIELRMRRRAPGEEVERLRLDRLGELEPLRRRCARWASDHLEPLRQADPSVPNELHDRATDNWRPLFAIADAAVGTWPERARRAAMVLSTGREDDEASAAVLLLGDLRRLFEERGVDRLASRDVVEALARMEDRPWPEWRRGNPITTRQLARLLRPFELAPSALWIDGKTQRGYEREHFRDPFLRYLGGADRKDRKDPHDSATNGPSAIRKDGDGLTDPRPSENPSDTTGLTVLTDQDPPPRPKRGGLGGMDGLAAGAGQDDGCPRCGGHLRHDAEPGDICRLCEREDENGHSAVDDILGTVDAEAES